MIALPGLCISTGRYECAKSILRTFALNERNGLMPNLFPEESNEPMYNTADAALLFINCVYLLYTATEDEGFVREMYPVMERIIKRYQNGTEYGIHMDEDGLILAGEGLDQVTWRAVSDNFRKSMTEKIHVPRKAVLPRRGAWGNCFVFMKSWRRNRCLPDAGVLEPETPISSVWKS